MTTLNSPALWSIGGGLTIGLLFGAVMQRSRFCMVAMVSNLLVMRDFRQTQAFLAAWAVAITGTGMLASLGYVQIGESAYLAPRIDWLGAIAGGVLFGFGAALAGGCAARTIINAAEGQIGALLSLITMTIFTGITQYGALQPARVALLQWSAIGVAAGGSGIATLLHVSPWIAGLAFGAGCIALMRRLGPIAKNRTLILAGGAIGLLAVLAWLLTGWIAQDEFSPVAPASLTITGPLARIDYVLATGSGFKLDFGIALVLGIPIGAMGSAVMTGALRWTLPDPARIPHYLAGGAMMGIGAIFAGGCNIGQGLSGVSTLSVTSLLAAASIFSGAALGVNWWSRRA